MTNKRSIAQVKKVDLDQLPVPSINMSIPQEKDLHDRMVSLVEHMLMLHKLLAAAKTDHDKTLLQRQIYATDKQIDALVYELYGLNEKEIKTIESTIPSR